MKTTMDTVAQQQQQHLVDFMAPFDSFPFLNDFSDLLARRFFFTINHGDMNSVLIFPSLFNYLPFTFLSELTTREADRDEHNLYRSFKPNSNE